MKEFLEEHFIPIILVVLLLLFAWAMSISIPVREVCLSMGYPDSKTLFYADGPRAFCLNHLEAIEIPLP